MSDTDLMLTAWHLPGAKLRGVLVAEYAAHHGLDGHTAVDELYALIDRGLVERRNPKPGEGRYPKAGPHRGRPPSVYVLTELGEVALAASGARDSAGDG